MIIFDVFCDNCNSDNVGFYREENNIIVKCEECGTEEVIIEL